MQVNQKRTFRVNTYLKFHKPDQFKMESIFERFHDILIAIGHFTVMDGSEGEGDLVLIQTLSALLWKLFLKNTS